MSDAQRWPGAAHMTMAEALGEFGRWREPQMPHAERPGLESTLEILFSFCDELGPDCLDPFTCERIRRAQRRRGLAPAVMLPAERLIEILQHCWRLFPFQVVASSAVLLAFWREIPLLVHWLMRRHLAGPDQVGAFNEHRKKEAGPLCGLIRMQIDLERVAGCFSKYAASSLTVCPFKVRAQRSAGVVILEGEPGFVRPVALPPKFLHFFQAGWEVSMALAPWNAETWIPLASSWPCDPLERQKLWPGEEHS